MVPTTLLDLEEEVTKRCPEQEVTDPFACNPKADSSEQPLPSVLIIEHVLNGESLVIADYWHHYSRNARRASIGTCPSCIVPLK
jgi:hypothetical protein